MLSWKSEIQSLLMRFGQELTRDFHISNRDPACLGVYLIRSAIDLEGDQRLTAVVRGDFEKDGNDSSK